MKEIQITKLSGSGKGQARHFNTSPVSVGTAAGCDFRFDPTWDKTVSGSHALIEWNGTQWMIRDTGSRDGTLVNGRRISQPQAVGEGVEIELGQGGPRLKAVVPGGSKVPGAGAPPPLPPKKKSVLPMLVGSLVVLAILAGIGLILWKQSEGDSDERMAAISRQYENCVGLVVFMERDQQGKLFPLADSTAWAVGDQVFATNSHVSGPVAEALAKGQEVFVVLNKNADNKYRVTKAVTHPKYGKPLPNIEGKPPAVPAYDVGLLYVDGKLPNKFRIASQEELAKLDSGYRVAYIGFPSERLNGGGVDLRSPVATMQSGIITSNTDFWLARGMPKDRLLVAHNMGSAGGASGSPVFNSRGEIVAIHSAGNHITQVVAQNGVLKPTRAPSGVMINFAQRIDMLKDIYPAYGK